MSRAFAVVRREFAESVRTKTFILGTLFGPALMLMFIFLPLLFVRDRGGEASIVIVDETGIGLGAQLEAVLESAPPAAPGAVQEQERPHFRDELVVLAQQDASELRASLLERVESETVDGFLWLRAGVLAGDSALYEGKNATNFIQIEVLRGALQRTVQQMRLAEAGIAPEQLAVALQRVPFEARKTGRAAASGTTESLLFLAQILGFATYMVVILYGSAVARGVLEEKRDRIVEIVVSSIRAQELMIGKVLGIGGAGLLQMLVWTGFAALALTQGEAVVTGLGGTMPELPDVPLAVGITFLVFFAGGYFLYSCIFAALGAMATTDQEIQQMQFPVVMVLAIGFMMMFTVLVNPEGGAAVAGSLIPFTSPIVMPIRVALSGVPLAQLAGAVALLAATGLLLVWAAGKIYRIGIFATGKRPTPAEVLRWLRAA